MAWFSASVFLKGTTDRAKPGHELFVRCKIASKGTSDFHGLILGGRALDCEARRGLGFRPGPMTHVLDSLGVHLPRCENFSAERKDRAYPFRSVLSAVDQEAEGHLEPETGPRAMVVYAGEEGATLLPGEGALLPVRIAGNWTPEVSSCEVVLPVAGKVEAVPGIWDTGAREGMVLVTPYQEEVVLEEGDPVGELRAGAVVSGTCSCGAVDTVFVSQTAGLEPDTCQECGLEQPSLIGSVCYSCGRKGEIKSTPLQGCKCRAKTPRKARESRKGYGVFATFAVGLAALTAAYAFDPSQYESKSWSRAGASFSSLRREESRARTSFSNPRREEVWVTFPGGWVRTHPEAREKLFEFSEEASAPLTLNVDQLDSRRVTTGQFLDGESLFWEDSWREGDPWVFKGRPWVGETRFYAVGHGSEGSWRSTMTEPVFHIVEAPGGIDKMAEETPTERYYDALRRSLEKRFPKANQFLLDHLISLEAFLDKSIVFGFSYGVAKAEICKEGGKLLGHIVGRNGSEPDPERAKAVMDFAPLREKLHIQQFLGCSNWLRMYLPAEYGVCSKILTGYQRPDATFPPEGLGHGSTEGCKAVRAIKRMLAKSISLAMIDEASAISGACPLEQVADASGFAVGGTVVQMTRDHTRLKVLLTHSKSLTPPQQAWPPLVQEAFAQLEMKRATRKTFGTIRTLCWTDHANLTKAQHIDVGADVKLVRWVAEILADGSEIRSLSGRSAKLGDGFSRNPRDRDELLENRTKDLQGMAGQLKGFDLEAYLGGDTEDPDIPVAWAIGNDVVPGGASLVDGADPCGGVLVSRLYAGATATRQLKVLFLGDYTKHMENASEIVRLRSTLAQAMPGWEIAVRASEGPFEDDVGNTSHLDGAAANLKGERQVKRLRVDLLTACAKALRAMGSYLPDFAVGVGQGAVVLGLLRLPLVVEVTLQARNLQRKEIREVVSGWSGVKSIWRVNPRLWRTQAGGDLLKAACPEVSRVFPEEPTKGFGVVTRSPKEESSRQVCDILGLGVLKDISEAPLMNLAVEPGRDVWEHDGRCSCGKRAYVFGRCTTCIEKEASDDFRAAAAAREALEPEGAEAGDGELLAEELMVLSAVPTAPNEPKACFVNFRLVQSWAKAWEDSGRPGGFHDLPGRLGKVAGLGEGKEPAVA